MLPPWGRPRQNTRPGYPQAITKLTRQVSLDASFQQKSNPTMTDLYQAFPKVALGYKALSYLRLKVGSRYAFVWDEDKRTGNFDFFKIWPCFYPLLDETRLPLALPANPQHPGRDLEPQDSEPIALSVAVSDYFRPGLFYEHFSTCGNPAAR